MGGLWGAGIGGVIGGALGARDQIIRNIKAAEIGAPKGTILKGAPIQAGRTQWTLNNTPKTTTVGATPPKVPVLKIGDIDFGIDEVVGYKFVDEQPVPILKEGAKTVFKGEYTKSNLKLGRDVHSAYKAGLADEIKTFKEYREIKGIRPDFVDWNTKTIYELKPFNPKAIQAGEQQLLKYKTLFEEKYPGTKWKTVLDVYYKK